MKVAVIGSGNIGTDLMFKVMRLSERLEFAVMVGIDPDSDGLARAARLGFETTHEGVEGLIRSPQFDEIAIVFDATSASAHRASSLPTSFSGLSRRTRNPADCIGGVPVYAPFSCSGGLDVRACLRLGT